jgi:hypothetical protein
VRQQTVFFIYERGSPVDIQKTQAFLASLGGLAVETMRIKDEKLPDNRSCIALLLAITPFVIIADAGDEIGKHSNTFNPGYG